MAYTRSAIVVRYAHVPDGWTQTSALLNASGTLPCTIIPRPTLRGSTRITASAERSPTDPVTVYVPGVSATKAPLSSTCATPDVETALTAQRTGGCAMVLPLASRA